MFPGFTEKRIRTSGAEIHLRIGGEGPPLLLLHGYPQTHVMWAKLAPRLAERFTVVCPDLRGYGDSSKPEGGDRHQAYSKREMAKDQIEVMDALGFGRFQVAAHDRGARVTHRMLRDHPGRVQRAAIMDIVPTLTAFEETDAEMARTYFHWFFLIQSGGLPERMIGDNADFYLRWVLDSWGKTPGFYDQETFQEYLRCFSKPDCIQATCEDYRAASDIDLEHDRADLATKIEVPLLILWGNKGFVGRKYDVLSVWRERAETVTGEALPCGHFVPEECPEETCAALLNFMDSRVNP
jgi:haloacetate dehalogenase